MLVLALDTSSPAVTAALVALGPDDHAELVAQRVVVDGRRHGELLAGGVREVLAASEGQPLTAIVVGTGPGPFTGLRVGLVTAAALADALGIPAYGVCSLDAVAPVGHVAVVTDARRREVYWARYRDGVRLEGPGVAAPADVAQHLSTLPSLADPFAPPDRPLVVGAGAVLHRTAFAGLELDEQHLHPEPVELVRCAASRVLSGAASEPLTPLYLRRPDAVEPGAVKRVTAAVP
ncbi:MAG: peptidase glycoprotease [Frankiales bacterium]|nr:peptidase glycoprotease [Frankiales bacterium]